MNEKQHSGILVMLVPQIIKEIMINDGVSEDVATLKFYESALCKGLEEEATKLWHLSPKALYELYHQEMETGHIVFPEEA